MEKKFPLFKGRLFAAFECSPKNPRFSRGLVYANLRDVRGIIATLPKIPIITRKRNLLIRLFYSSVACILFLFIISPSRFVPSLTRVFFNRDILSPLFIVSPGDYCVEKGKDITLSLKALQGRISNPELIIGNARINIKRKNRHLYSTTIESIEKPFVYYLQFSDTFSEKYKVDVVEHPGVESIIFTLHFPPYTKEKSYQTNDFDIYALKGTRIDLSGKSTQMLKGADLFFDDSKCKSLDVKGNVFTGSFYVTETETFTIDLLSEKGLENSEKALFHIFSYNDEYPFIEIVEPGKDVDLPQELAVDIVANVSDDYGILKVRLVWEKDKEKHFIRIASSQKERNSTCKYRWDLMHLPMFPGDTLLYYVEVFDNDIVSGPKVKRSKTFSIRFPTAEEIYREVAGGGERSREVFERESDKLEDIKKGFQELERALRESKNLSWESRKKVEEIIKKEKELLENIEETRKEMEELTKRIDNTFLNNPGIREKLEEIKKLMKQLETAEIKKHMEELQKALGKMERKSMLKAMEKMMLSQEEFKSAIDRTLEMLKRFEQEERFKKLIKEVEKIKDEQKKINKEIGGKRGEKQKDLEQREKGLEEELGNLSKEMEELARELGKDDLTAKNALEKGSKMTPDIKSQMKEVRKAMKRSNQKRSLALGEKAEKSLSNLSNMLSGGLSSMLSQRKKELEKKLYAIIEDVVFLSFETEKAMNNIKREMENDEILSLEDGIKEGIDKTLLALEKLKAKNPFIPPMVDDALIRAANNIKNSSNNLLKNNYPGSFVYAKRTMGSLNNAALELIENMENLQSSGSGSMSQLLQQLQSLSSGQMQVNNGTEAIFPMTLPSGNIPQEVQRQLQRLSELQGSLAERMKRLNEGLEGNDGELLGDMGKIADEMKEVAKEIGNYNVDRKLIERQERILSRMLDAERSIHKREFSKKRVAERPGEYIKSEPLPLPREPGKKKGIRKDIVKELEEKYPEEYRDLIRAYFNRLLKEEKNNR